MHAIAMRAGHSMMYISKSSGISDSGLVSSIDCHLLILRSVKETSALLPENPHVRMPIKGFEVVQCPCARFEEQFVSEHPVIEFQKPTAD